MTTYWHFDHGEIGLRRLNPADRGRSILCFPHAGAQSLAFRQLAECLKDATVYGIDPPGHGWATGQPLSDMDSLIDRYCRHLPEEILKGSVLLGHSMGAYVALRMAHKMCARFAAPPALILSAARPPHRRGDGEQLASLPDDKLRSALMRLGSLPQGSAESLIDRFLPAIRADFAVLEHCQMPIAACPVPTLVVGGIQDEFCSPWYISEWDRYVSSCQIQWIDAGHFFAQSHPAQMAQHVSSFLDKIDPPCKQVSP